MTLDRFMVFIVTNPLRHISGLRDIRPRAAVTIVS